MSMNKMIRTKKPIRMWIDGKCFNIKQHKKDKKPPPNTNLKESQSADEAEGPPSTEHGFIINPTKTGKLATSFRLPSIYYIRLNRLAHFNLKNVEKETNTEVTIPQNGNDGYIIVTGDKEEDIVNAREAIHSAAGEIRDTQTAALQFISIPVHTEEVQRNFETFKNQILNGDSIEGMHESIFQSSAKLHLTVVVFALMDDAEKTEAIAALNDCKTSVIQAIVEQYGPLKIKVSGIGTMNDNLQKVNVLYANAKIEHAFDDNILQRLTNGISDYFYERGLVKQYQDNVKLHVTLINTKYRKSDGEESPAKKKSRWHSKRQSFDARGIIEKYKDFYFGESMLDSVHLSYITSKGEDGFYKPLSIIKF